MGNSFSNETVVPITVNELPNCVIENAVPKNAVPEKLFLRCCYEKANP